MSKKYITRGKVLIIFLFLFCAICGVCAGIFISLLNDLPQIRALSNFKPSAITKIYSADNILLAELFAERREYVPLKMIPDYLQKAIIATEDQNFFKHKGIDARGLFRALIKDIMSVKFVEGGSTITQQLAKTLFLSPEKKALRKAREAMLAVQLERRYTKNELLELYLNQVYFGSGAYGVESAAGMFFDKPVNELNLSECAMIAGMPKSPSRYSPLINRELAIKRKNIVLKQMAKLGFITQAELSASSSAVFELKNKIDDNIKSPYFVDYIRKELEEIVGIEPLYNDGLTIHTTLSYALQEAAEKAVSQGLIEIKDRMLKNNSLEYCDPQAALIAINVETGGILAMVGGSDYLKSPYNRAVQSQRQPGSAFKPIIYALAIEKGICQNKIMMDTPIVLQGTNQDKNWSPENSSDTYSGGITLRNSLIYSKNIPTVRLVKELGTETVADFAHKLGIKSDILPNLSIALGTSEVTLLELTSAYAVFPNKGIRIEPFGIDRILDQRGEELFRNNPDKNKAMSVQNAAIVTDMLKGVIKYGTGKKAKGILGDEIAGKTGTTDENKDALFIGFSPSIAAGVYVGNDDAKSLGKLETGAQAALPIWINFMKKALNEMPYKYFDIPEGVISVAVDAETGKSVEDNSSSRINILIKESDRACIQ